MILSGCSIIEKVKSGEIVIDPFDEKSIGPNSYDFHLGDRCKVYEERVLDSAQKNSTIDLAFNDNGLMLNPDRVYLINTLEIIGSNQFVPIIRGRSSVGRLGLFVNITADLIDVGYINNLTLQLHCVQPVNVYPGMPIGQVTFWEIEGNIRLYKGKYNNTESPMASLSYFDIEGYK